MEKIAFMGCSRGLGKAVAELWSKPCKALLCSRKIQSTGVVENSLLQETQLYTCDFSQKDNEELLNTLADFQPTRIFYFTGGGPHGDYFSKEWKDHLWAFQVNFLTPARILSWSKNMESVQQMILVGSSIAEGTIEPLSPSYGAAKKALAGLVYSVQQTQPNFDLRLFSPGYMDTDLLPPNAEPRKLGICADPKQVGRRFVEWATDEDGVKHLCLP